MIAVAVGAEQRNSPAKHKRAKSQKAKTSFKIRVTLLPSISSVKAIPLRHTQRLT